MDPEDKSIVITVIALGLILIVGTSGCTAFQSYNERQKVVACVEAGGEWTNVRPYAGIGQNDVTHGCTHSA